MARIDTAGQMNGRPLFDGKQENGLRGTADYGNTTANWDSNNTSKLQWDRGLDPSVETIQWSSWSKYAGWINTQLGYTKGRYMSGAWITGCEFQWRTYPNENGGIALRRWGIGIAQRDGTLRKRWSSNEVNEWSTSSSWKTIGYNFDGTLLSQLNNGWVFDELHFMVHTPSDRNTPSQNCKLEVRNFKFRYKRGDAIVPAMRLFRDRAEYPIA